MLDGRDPHTDVALGRRFGDRSARAFDATFSAPKSVSALWGLSDDRFVQAEVLAAHDAAVDAALGWLETHGAVTRRGTDGIWQVDTQGLTVAVFRQHTSRTADPQLHSHALILAKVQDPSGTWLSVDARFLMTQQRTIGWIYDAALRGELTRRLGVGWDRNPSGTKDLTCIPAAVRDVLSKRDGQVAKKLAELIERWSDEHDGAEPDPRTIAALERNAAITSRPNKHQHDHPNSLRRAWSDQARAVGFNPDRLELEQLRTERLPAGGTDDEIVDEALRRVSEESATWLRADLARHIATLLPDQARTAGEIAAEIDRLALAAESRCLAIGPERSTDGRLRRDGRPLAEHVVDHRFTTPAILDQETRLQEWARRAANGPSRSDWDLQLAAESAIAGHHPVVLLVGPAGAGKTRTIARAVERLHHQHRPVLGLAPSGKAADVLGADAGCDTMTLARLLTTHYDRATSPVPPRATVILDEAGMVLEPGTTRNHAYVAMTRGRHSNIAWLPDPTGLAGPADQFDLILTRDTDQRSALATHAALHRNAGLPRPAIGSVGTRPGPDEITRSAPHQDLPRPATGHGLDR